MFCHATQTSLQSFMMVAGTTASSFTAHISAACLLCILSSGINMAMRFIVYEIRVFITQVNAMCLMNSMLELYKSLYKSLLLHWYKNILVILFLLLVTSGCKMMDTCLSG